MKFVSLKVGNYKNLSTDEFRITSPDGITVLIGDNGSGKSNLLEAICAVFSCLYNPWKNRPEFDFEIKYELSGGQKIQVVKNGRNLLYSVNSQQIKNYKEFKDSLPSGLICSYSGEELRLWHNYFFGFYENYLREVIVNKRSADTSLQMLFLNKYFWHIALFTLAISDVNMNDVLKDITVDSLELSINQRNLLNFAGNSVTGFVSTLKTLSEQNNNGPVPFDEVKNTLRGLSHERLFNHLMVACLPKKTSGKLLNNFRLLLRKGAILFYADELSEGEKKQILIKCITVILAKSDSLILMDEPDSHIHINQQETIKHLLYQTDGTTPQANSILTTHSPTLTQAFSDDNVIMLDKGTPIKKSRQQIIAHLTDGFWSRQQQNIFLASDKPLVLVEGPGDADYIHTAIDRLGYSTSLIVDVLHFGGASNAKEFLGELRKCCDLSRRKIIVLFDRDEAGKDGMYACIGKGDRGNFETYSKEGVAYLMLPKTLEHRYIEMTMEDYFPTQHKRDILMSMVQEVEGYFKKIPKDLITPVKKKLAKDMKELSVTELNGFRVLLDKLMAIVDEKEVVTILEI